MRSVTHGSMDGIKPHNQSSTPACFVYYRKKGLCACTCTCTCTEGPGDDRRRWNLAVGHSSLIPAHCVPVLLGTAAQITLHATIVRATKSGLDPRVWHVSLPPEMLMQQCGFSCGPWLHLVTTVLHFVIIDGATLYETHREREESRDRCVFDVFKSHFIWSSI